MPPPTRDIAFISYSHEDTKWREDLEKHLKPYLRAGSIKGWSDKQIVPGSKWFGEIKSALVQTNVAVLLVTHDFLASDFIHEHELGPLLKEAEQGGVKILWVPVRESAYKQTPLKNYQAVIDPQIPLAAMTKAKRDKAWVKICEEIKKAVNPTSLQPKGDFLPQPPAEDEAAANAGNPAAMFDLGLWYENSKHRDYAKAGVWYQKAAEAGDKDAMVNLGVLYEDGLGVTQDYVKAREWYQKAAEAGDKDAMVNLGTLYEEGFGDYAKAREWYQKAAEAGDKDAMVNLGILYENGLGVTQDYVKAREWYQKAANRGVARAKKALAKLSLK